MKKALPFFVLTTSFSFPVMATVLTAKVRCVVRDPRGLREVMGLEVGHWVSVASYDDGTSNLDRNGTYALTQYPGVLGFQGAAFKMRKTEIPPPLEDGSLPGSPIEVDMQGNVEGDRRGILSLKKEEDNAENFSGDSDLEHCERVDLR